MENTHFENRSQGSLPLTGRYTAEAWAKFFDIETKTLLANIKKHSIRVIKFGGTPIIDAAIFWDDLLKSGEQIEEE